MNYKTLFVGAGTLMALGFVESLNPTASAGLALMWIGFANIKSK